MSSPLNTHLQENRPSSEQRPRVSIIIVNFNGAKLLPACLRSLGSVIDSTVETILVDNASSDASLEVLKDFPWVHIVRSARNLGFAGGNNLGLAHSSGHYILLLNTDTVTQGNFVESLCQYLDQNSQVGVVQGKMLLPNFGNTLDVCGSFLTVFGLPYHFGYYKKDAPTYQRNYPVFSGKGACLMFRRELIPRVGGFLFDEDFFCYYEESDFCHRVWLAGYEVHFVASPPIQHLMGGTAGGPQSGFVLQHYLRNMAFSLSANLSFASRARIFPLFYGLLIFIAMISALTLRSEKFSAATGAIAQPWIKSGKVRARRKLIQSLRKKSDREIFAKVLRTPRLSYFFKTFSGKLSDYQDEELA
jgi:GT2 family glycosyltransferase